MLLLHMIVLPRGKLWGISNTSCGSKGKLQQQRETNQADNNTYYTKQLEKLQQAVCKLDILFPNANLGKFIKFI